MKKCIFILGLVAFALNTFGQGTDYEKIMSETAAKWKGIQGPEDMQHLANTYERIGQVAGTEWLPRYYASYMYVIKAFNVEKGKDDILDKAQENLDAARELGGDESEIAALQSFLYLGRLVVNTMVRGMTYSGKVEKAANKAIALNETNPRGHYILAMYYEGMPRFLGGGMGAACPHYQSAKKHYESFEAATDLHPTWGKNTVLQKVGGCTSNEGK